MEDYLSLIRFMSIGKALHNEELKVHPKLHCSLASSFTLMLHHQMPSWGHIQMGSFQGLSYMTS
jgi:hypothetical protein